MEDYVIGAIVGGIPLAMLLSISLFYSANQRLPHWLGNLCALPPTFSFKPKDATTQEYHDQVTVSIALLSGTPLLLCFVLYVFLISEIDVWSVSEWDTPLDVTTCAAAVLEEQNLHALLLSGIASTTNLTSYDVSKMHSAEVCADVPLGNLLSARGATDFRGAISSYELFYSDLMDTMLQKLNTILSSDERATVVNNVALLAVDSAVLDCEAVSDAASDNPFNATLNLKSIHFNTAAKALLNTVLLHLSDPSETYFHGLSSFYPLPDHTTIRTDRATHPSTASTPTNNIVQQTTHYADVLLQLSLHFDNRLRQVSEVGYENQSNIEHYVIAAFGVGLLLLAMACIIVVMVAHTIKLSWEVRLRKDFEGSNDNKDLYQGHIQNAGKLIVDGELEAGSEVELCFVNIIKSFREVKPFASHSLFEGELTDTEELFCEHPEVHTHRYALREEIGLRFKHAACMSVSTRLLNEFSVDEAEECADDITQDYSLLVAIIYKAASQYGGVVHNVTSGVITCTWNVSLMCTHPTERAMECAFALEDMLDEASSKDQFCFIPEELPKIAVCSGPVMAGLIKCHISQNTTIGSAPMFAEHMARMDALQATILIDSETEHVVHGRYCTSPVMYSNGNVIFEAQPDAPSKDEDRTREYGETFVHLRKGKKQLAIAALKSHISKERRKVSSAAEALLQVLLQDEV